MLNIVFRASADAQLVAAKAWYDQQRHGLGDEFARSLKSAINRIARNPLSTQNWNVMGCCVVHAATIIHHRSNISTPLLFARSSHAASPPQPSALDPRRY